MGEHAARWSQKIDGDWEKKVKALRDKAWVNYVCGLMCFQLSKPKDKVALRDCIVTYKTILEQNGLDRTDLPIGLQKRVDSALKLM